MTRHDIVSIPCDLTRSAHARDDGYRTLNDDTIVDNVTVHVAWLHFKQGPVTLIGRS